MSINYPLFESDEPEAGRPTKTQSVGGSVRALFVDDETTNRTSDSSYSPLTPLDEPTSDQWVAGRVAFDDEMIDGSKNNKNSDDDMKGTNNSQQTEEHTDFPEPYSSYLPARELVFREDESRNDAQVMRATGAKESSHLLDYMENAPPIKSAHPAVDQAVERLKNLYPAVDMIELTGIRSLLEKLIPVDFDRVQDFCLKELKRAASLIENITTGSKSITDIDADKIINTIIENAKKSRKGKSLVGFVLGNDGFDPNEAKVQLSYVKKALMKQIDNVKSYKSDLKNSLSGLKTGLMVLSTLNDMSDHGSVGQIIERKSRMMTASIQELELAIRQIDAIDNQTKNWVMTCDEVVTVTLPALGWKI